MQLIYTKTTSENYINRLGIDDWKWNVIIYIYNRFQINYVVVFCQMVIRAALQAWSGSKSMKLPQNVSRLVIST